MKIVSRKEAKEKGLTKYYTGKPCKHGHVYERYTKSGNCIYCQRNFREGYYNPDYYKEYRRVNKAKRQKYLQENRCRILKQRKEYRKLNPAKVVIRKLTHRHQAPVWLTPEDWRLMNKIYFNRDRLNAKTGTTYVVDHIVPIKGKGVRGLHVPWNLQTISQADNVRKGSAYDKYPLRNS